MEERQRDRQRRRNGGRESKRLRMTETRYRSTERLRKIDDEVDEDRDKMPRY